MATYTLTASTGAVLISNDIGYYTYWQGFTALSGLTDSVLLEDVIGDQLTMKISDIATIGGSPAANTVPLVLAQINTLFNTAYKQN